MHRSFAAAAVTAAALAVPATAHAAGAYAPDTVLVKPSSSHRMRALAHDPAVDGTLATIPGTGARVLRVSGDPAAVARRLRRARGVRWAEPNWIVHATAAPGDPLLGQAYGVGAIGAPAAWDALGLGAFPQSGGVPVGIVDTGIDATHEDLAGKVLACATSTDGAVSEGSCADDAGHGTHVAGTIGAIAGNRVGVAGVAFSSPLIVCRALGADGSGTIADVAACIRWAHDAGAKVISMSLGGPSSKTLAAAVTAAWNGGGRGGSLIVAAAGNDGDGEVEYPAGLPDVVSVAAVDASDAHAPFSNANADVEVAAPGVDVLSTKLGGGYVRMSGTSMATPHASGAAALLWDASPGAFARTIRKRLDAAVDDLGAPGRDPLFGYGRIDLTRAFGG
ncbi:MAG TPA: S8 family peptidase [Solirubrobacteraceae bacterium]|nr:S8 family peptidase [Solirubrobacteraceae bacterium]